MRIAGANARSGRTAVVIEVVIGVVIGAATEAESAGIARSGLRIAAVRTVVEIAAAPTGVDRTGVGKSEVGKTEVVRIGAVKTAAVRTVGAIGVIGIPVVVLAVRAGPAAGRRATWVADRRAAAGCRIRVAGTRWASVDSVASGRSARAAGCRGT